MDECVDLVVRGGLIYDGSGSRPFIGDVAVSDGTIVAVGALAVKGREEIDASGLIVTPGFIDIHTHYDGHVTWTNRLSPSCNHGVTTVVMGNCGVGFAPCRPHDHDTLIRLMEGVEDIPGIVMAEGLPWTWETFPEYFDFLAGRAFDVDVAAYLPHAPLRLYVMGERALARAAATDDEIREMSRIAEEAIGAGALGFATSRSLAHKASDGMLITSYSAEEKELKGIARGLKRAGAGILQMISDFDDADAEFAMIRRVLDDSGRPFTFTLVQLKNAPDRWRWLLDKASEAKREGVPITAQICGRPVGVLAGLELTMNPFSFCPSYPQMAHLPLAERLETLRNPELRAKLVAEYPSDDSWHPVAKHLVDPSKMYLLDKEPDYEPAAEQSLAAQAAARGLTPAHYMYDLLTEDDGRNIFFVPVANFENGRTDAVETMMRSDVTVPALGDGGAHCGTICDASLPTYNLSRWTYEDEGRLSLQAMIRALTADCAAAVELNDRGRIAVGLRGDLNVIDIGRLGLGRPHMVYDLPSGSGHLDQRATGYVATIVAGQTTYRDGEPTGALPGRLVRGSCPGAG